MNRGGHRRQQSQQQVLPMKKTSSEINNFTSKLPLLHLQAAQAQRVLSGPKTNLNIHELDFRNKRMSIRQAPQKSIEQKAKILERQSRSSERTFLEPSSEREEGSTLAAKGGQLQVGAHLSLYFPYFKRGANNKNASSVSRRPTQKLRLDESQNDFVETNKPITEEFQKSNSKPASKLTQTKLRNNNNSDQKDMRIKYQGESQLIDQKGAEEGDEVVKLSPFGLAHRSHDIDKPRSSQLSNEILRDTMSQHQNSKESLDRSSGKGMNQPVYYTATTQNAKQDPHSVETKDQGKRSGPLKAAGSSFMDEKLKVLWQKETARMQQQPQPPQQYKMSINTLRYEPKMKRDGHKQQRSPTQRNHNLRLEQLKHRQSGYVKSLSSKMQIQGVKLPNVDDQLLRTSSISKSKEREGKHGQKLKTQASNITPTNKSRDLEANLSITNINERTLSSKDQPQPTSSPRQQIEMKLHLPTTPPFNKAAGPKTGAATHFSSSFIQSNDPYDSRHAIEGTAGKTIQGSGDSDSTDGKRDAAAGRSIAEESRGRSKEELLDLQQRDVLRQKSEYQKILEFDMDLKKQTFRNFEGFRPKQLRKQFVAGSQDQASQLSQSMNLNISELMRDGQLLQKMSPRKLVKKLKESITLPKQRDSIKIQPTNNARDALLNPLDNLSSQSRWLKNYAFEMRDGYLQPFSFQDAMPFDRKPSIDHQFKTHFTSSINFGQGYSSASKQIMHSDSLGEQTTPYGSTIKTTTNDASRSDDRLLSNALPTSHFGTRTTHQYQQVGSPGTAGFGGKVAVQGNESRFRNTVQGQGTMGPSGPAQGPTAGAKQKGNVKPSDLLDERGKQALEEKSLSAINSPRKLSYMMKRQHVGVSESPENLLASPSVNFGFKPKIASLKNRTPRSLRKIDFARSTLFEDNNLNVELYRSQIGDQKYTHRNRYKNVGGPSSKKMSYHSNLANRALKIAGMGIDPNRYIESEQTPTMPAEKIIFAGQEIENKELNFESCSKYYNVQHGFQNVHKDIEKSSLVANAKQLKKLPLFKNVKMKNLTNTMTSMRFQELKMQHQNQYFTPRNSDLHLSHYSSKLMRSRHPFDIDMPDDFLSEINQDSEEMLEKVSSPEPINHFKTNIFELVSKEKKNRRNKSSFMSKVESNDQIRKLTEQSLMVHTAERFLSQLKLQDKVKKFTSQQQASLILQPLISKDYFQELQAQNQLDQRISQDMELSLNSQQVLNIKNLKYLQGLKRKTNVKIVLDKNQKNKASNMITEQMKTNAKEFQDKIRDLQNRSKYYQRREFLEKHQQCIQERATPEQYQDQIQDLNADFEDYQQQQQDRIANMRRTLTNYAGGSQSPNKKSGRIEHQRTSIQTKLQESNFYVNLAREQKRQDFLKRNGGFEEDYYISCKQQKRKKRILDEIEDDKLMKKLQDQSMERDLRKIVRKKLDEMTFIEDSVDRWSPDSHSSDPLGDLGDDISQNSDGVETGLGNSLVTQSVSKEDDGSKSSEDKDEDFDPDMRKHHPADEKIKQTQDQLDRMEEQKKVFEESKKEFTDKILNDQIHELATRINQEILEEFKKLKQQGVFRRSTAFKFKQKRMSVTLEGKYEKRVNEVLDLLKSNFLDLQKLKQDIMEIQQVARDEEDKENVFKLLATKIAAQHESILQSKEEYRRKLSKDGIKMIDDYTQQKLEEQIARRNHNLMLINNYIKNGGDFSLLGKLYQKQYQEAKLNVLKECYLYYKGQIEKRREQEQKRLQRKEAQQRALQKLKEQQYRLKRMEEDDDI